MCFQTLLSLPPRSLPPPHSPAPHPASSPTQCLSPKLPSSFLQLQLPFLLGALFSRGLLQLQDRAAPILQPSPTFPKPLVFPITLPPTRSLCPHCPPTHSGPPHPPIPRTLCPRVPGPPHPPVPRTPCPRVPGPPQPPVPRNPCPCASRSPHSSSLCPRSSVSPVPAHPRTPQPLSAHLSLPTPFIPASPVLRTSPCPAPRVPAPPRRAARRAQVDARAARGDGRRAHPNPPAPPPASRIGSRWAGRAPIGGRRAAAGSRWVAPQRGCCSVPPRPGSVEPERPGGGRGSRELRRRPPGPRPRQAGVAAAPLAAGGGQRAMRGRGLRRGARGSRGPQRRR